MADEKLPVLFFKNDGKMWRHFFPSDLSLSHQRFPYHRPIPQPRLAKTPLFAAPILSRNYFV